jgi:hypothetical protein
MRSTKFKGTGYLSRDEALAISRVSSATLVRALRIGRSDRAHFGCARAPGLRHKFIGNAIAIHEHNLRAWMEQRKRLGCRPGVSVPLTPKKRSG